MFYFLVLKISQKWLENTMTAFNNIECLITSQLAHPKQRDTFLPSLHHVLIHKTW